MKKLSILLTKDDIARIDSEEIQRKIMNAISESVKEIAATTAQAIALEIDILPTSNTSETLPVFNQNRPFST